MLACVLATLDTMRDKRPFSFDVDMRRRRLVDYRSFGLKRRREKPREESEDRK